MQVAIYAGVPAGVDSFRIAREVFAETATRREAGTPSSPSILRAVPNASPARTHKRKNGSLRFAPEQRQK